MVHLDSRGRSGGSSRRSQVLEVPLEKPEPAEEQLLLQAVALAAASVAAHAECVVVTDASSGQMRCNLPYRAGDEATRTRHAALQFVMQFVLCGCQPPVE